jgi:malonyl-CoA O-methyltransferase
MFVNFDKQQLQKKFSQQANSYDKSAEIQFSAAQKLCKIVKPFLTKNCQILDLGSGTGFVAKNLQGNFTITETDISLEMLQKNTNSHTIKIQADFEKLPFENGSFDVITSSFSLQWATDFDKSFSHFFSLLKPNGIFAFCLPCEGSLQELREADIFSFNQLPSKKSLEKTLQKTGFKEILIETEIVSQEFLSGTDAIKSLKKTGANYSQKNRNIVTKTKLKQFNNFCLKKFGNESRSIDVTWSINHFIFKK